MKLEWYLTPVRCFIATHLFYTNASLHTTGNMRALTKDINFQNSLVGSRVLPSEIGRLSAMQEWVSLGAAGLSSTLPTELCQLSQLKAFLYVYGNNITGSLPSQVGHLNYLQSGFMFGGNSLSSSIPTELVCVVGWREGRGRGEGNCHS